MQKRTTHAPGVVRREQRKIARSTIIGRGVGETLDLGLARIQARALRESLIVPEILRRLWNHVFLEHDVIRVVLIAQVGDLPKVDDVFFNC
jgi:hypothetical protein